MVFGGIIVKNGEAKIFFDFIFCIFKGKMGVLGGKIRENCYYSAVNE